MAIYLLSDQLPEVTGYARAAARRLADRIGDLGGAVSGDTRQLIDRAPGGTEFTIPDFSDPRAITGYALQRLEVIVASRWSWICSPPRPAAARTCRPPWPGGERA